MNPNKPKKSKTGRDRKRRENAPSANFSPLRWSKWPYEIRTQLGVKTTKSRAYEDCRRQGKALLDR